MKKEKRRRVVLYLRVSTKAQTNLNQFKQLRKAADYHNWQIIAVFRDYGRSGKNTDRPGFKALQKKLRARGVDMVAIWSLSRIGRNLSDLVHFLDDDLKPNKVELFSLNDNIDTTTASGRMVYQIIASVAEYEREHTREKVMAALDRARAQGKKLGRPRTTDPKNKKYNPALVANIQNLIAQGVKIRQIGPRVGVSRNTVKSIIREAENGETEAS